MSDLTKNFEWPGVQYKLTNIQELIKNISEIYETQLNNVMNQFVQKLSIDTANGVWLDYLGYRLGVSDRPSVQASQTAFGFDGAGLGFDQAPFQSSSTDRVPIDDELYRNFLRSRAAQLLTDGSNESIRNALLYTFDEVYVIDNYDMTMTVYIFSDLSVQVVQALLDSDIISRPAAVEVNVQIIQEPLFGFDGAGDAVGFDQAPFVYAF